MSGAPISVGGVQVEEPALGERVRWSANNSGRTSTEECTQPGTVQRLFAGKLPWDEHPRNGSTTGTPAKRKGRSARRECDRERNAIQKPKIALAIAEALGTLLAKALGAPQLGQFSR